MKKKLVAFAVTAAMVITSAVPVFAATPGISNWENGAAISEDGIKLVVDDDRIDGAKLNIGERLYTGQPQTHEIMIDLSSDYDGDKYELFQVSLSVGNENGGYIDEHVVMTTAQPDGTFTLTDIYGLKAAGIEPGIYTYRYTVEKSKSGYTEIAFQLIDDSGRIRATSKHEVSVAGGNMEDEVMQVRNIWVFGRSVAQNPDGTDRYLLDRPLVMYTEEPGYVTDVAIVDENGEEVTNLTNGQTVTTKITMSSGLEIIGTDSHFTWQWRVVAKNGRSEVMTKATGASYTVNFDQMKKAAERIGVKNLNDLKLGVGVVAKDGYYKSATDTTDYVTYFANTRIAGANRFETAVAVANALTASIPAYDASNTIIVASGDDYADALSGTYLAKVKKAPLLLLNDNNEEIVLDYIEKNLYMRDNCRVYILGGEGVISEDFENSIYKYHPVRLAGADRYETNLAILEEVGAIEKGNLLIASGNGYADALSAAATGNPVMLVGDKLTNAQKEFISECGAAKYYVIGGTGAVSNAVKNAVDNNNGDDGVTRLGGDNRYATNAKVVNTFAPTKASKVVLASGNDFADALTGGVYAAATNSPLALVNDLNTKTAKKIIKNVGAKSVTVIGGTGAVSDDILAKIA